MQIFVKTLPGKTLARDVLPTSTVSSVKEMIASAEGIPASEQRLIFAGVQMDDERALAEYGIQKESTINMVMSLCGGGKKRKKKNYTTPKKIKHKRKKVKMAILKYYKVGSDGKIQRLRRECPAPTCGAGIFMAWHKDRQACGKCGLTYTFEPGTKPTTA
ncbi:small subunit ribosomal protein S27Ae [Cryptococcus neoformans]|uniref:Ribosomal chaperone, putative n=3 Tax=Cryptococcus neoformans species complex TaxID=1897064 RepID=Q5KIG4_CRYD1|nr:small subunit ribosomal protein S27Ae [Cryptococcus neoformans var. grubii H99]XP_570192.1 ribosomal chaperone, putative [Cryptococcus neoformans var. neoformans JEC21]XP_775922.1 ubiquitin-40S ribosomal protein S31 fusion protein [Cryptococcus neoformans var. neoformans B-3501A]AUB24701.1 small subunit ribosomal protein S27Ae [Cryptococcus neoformans var. grubii]OWT39950.1 small subunit ribosomal protein S27Ae [Cryptococcus neoformans var. grubii Bt1]OWZ32417.1 small subunit ribosomal prot|eukprot:XP_012049370.1 small subunit ribosomal protein S27Ae [Cryptococcus neoformans var. grubii H99]